MWSPAAGNLSQRTPAWSCTAGPTVVASTLPSHCSLWQALQLYATGAWCRWGGCWWRCQRCLSWGSGCWLCKVSRVCHQTLLDAALRLGNTLLPKQLFAKLGTVAADHQPHCTLHSDQAGECREAASRHCTASRCLYHCNLWLSLLRTTKVQQARFWQAHKRALHRISPCRHLMWLTAADTVLC